MDLPQHVLAFKDEEMKNIEFPPVGVEYERVPSPPPSEHSSNEEEEDEMTQTPDNLNRRKKLRKTRAEYVELRNKEVAAYLKKLKENPPRNFSEMIALLREKRAKELRLRKGKNYVAKAKPEVPKGEDGDVCYSDTSRDSDCSLPRNTARTLRRDIQKTCYEATVEHQKQQLLSGDEQKVHFTHANFQMILEAKWQLIEMKRMEKILEGELLTCRIEPKWMTAGNEIQKIYGPMDMESEHFKKLVKAFEQQYIELNCLMIEKEDKLFARLLENKMSPTDSPALLAGLRVAISFFERKVAAMTELNFDQNPYTNQDGMDFWVIPRPKQTIKVYDVRNQETEDFLEFNLPLDEIGRPNLEDQYKLFIKEGYSPAVFDVGWHYSPSKIYGDIPWKGFFINDYGMLSRAHRTHFTEEKWRNHLLELRGDLMSFNPFGVESAHFYHHIRIKNGIREENSIFGNLFDHNGVDCLSDMFFPQTLVAAGGVEAKDKIILFDSLFEGVIVTPVEMLLRVWNRIRFLIGERPNQLLPLHTLQNIYETCFNQKLFPLQWGFKDVEDFVRNVSKYLPKEITEDVIIVERDRREEREMETSARNKAEEETRKEIDAKWAKILENDDGEEEDDGLMQFDDEDLFEELIHEGPWLTEGEVYRVVDE